MIRDLKAYILFDYFKYILIFVLAFIGLIWTSQILRIIDLNYSITNQIIKVFTATLYVLPSFINPLIPFLILISSFFLNNKLVNNGEKKIILQYLSKYEVFKIFITSSFILFFFYIINNEYISPKLYKNYKEKELELRNNFKIGIPANNEFHISNKLSLFFENHFENQFNNIEAIIYEDGQFIKADSATIEYDENGINIIFNYGERMILNKYEKSVTVFQKFIFNILNNKEEELYYDKEHYNTLELLQQDDIFFYYHGHKKIFEYLFALVILICCLIIFFSKNSKSYKKYFVTITLLLAVAILNNFYINLIEDNKITLIQYYIMNIFNLLLMNLFIYKIYNA